MSKKYTTESFIERAKKVHKEDYDYSRVNYIGSKEKIEIICKLHGSFFIRPAKFLSGQGCPKCRYIKAALHNPKRKTTEQFITESLKIHGDKYDYSNTKYVNAKTKVEIKCKTCGRVFFQEPRHHTQGVGCPYCKESHGEREIANCLDSLGYVLNKTYFREKIIDGFPYDFYIPSKNICIEYNGIQHYESVEHFGGEEKLKEQKRNDSRKKDICKIHNIRLITIPYWEKDVENILRKELS